MRQLIFLLLSILTINKFFCQSFKTLHNGMEPCWQSINVTDSLEAVVIKYFPKKILCGKFPSISIAIVKLTNGDTVRVRQFCAITKDIQANEIVIIYPYKHMDTENVIVPSNEEALTCKIIKTFDGGLRKK